MASTSQTTTGNFDGLQLDTGRFAPYIAGAGVSPPDAVSTRAVNRAVRVHEIYLRAQAVAATFELNVWIQPGLVALGTPIDLTNSQRLIAAATVVTENIALMSSGLLVGPILLPPNFSLAFITGNKSGGGDTLNLDVIWEQVPQNR